MAVWQRVARVPQQSGVMYTPAHIPGTGGTQCATASKSTSHPHLSLQQLLGDGGDTERSVTWELVILPRDDGCWHSARVSTDPPGSHGEAGGSRGGWQCNERAGPLQRGVRRGKEGELSLPTVNTALGELRAFTPRSCQRPAWSAGPPLAHGTDHSSSPLSRKQ